MSAYKRKGMGKRKRFAVFSRDNFTCRYCGRQSDVVPLEVDHIIPVCKGGTDDIENLLTACVDCNRGKAGNAPTHAAPTESDRLRLAQERQEQMLAAKQASDAAKARAEFEQVIVNYWCRLTGRNTVCSATISVITSYARQYGPDLVFQWIEKAARVASYNDRQMGKYVSGIRRSHEKESA